MRREDQAMRILGAAEQRGIRCGYRWVFQANLKDPVILNRVEAVSGGHPPRTMQGIGEFCMRNGAEPDDVAEDGFVFLDDPTGLGPAFRQGFIKGAKRAFGERCDEEAAKNRTQLRRKEGAP
jgi:hypothetical protein